MSQVEWKEFCRKTLGGFGRRLLSPFQKKKKACWGNRSFRRVRQRVAGFGFGSQGIRQRHCLFCFLLEQQNSELCPLNSDYLGRPCRVTWLCRRTRSWARDPTSRCLYSSYENRALAIAMLRGFNELILINYIEQNLAQVSPQLLNNFLEY